MFCKNIVHLRYKLIINQPIRRIEPIHNLETFDTADCLPAAYPIRGAAQKAKRIEQLLDLLHGPGIHSLVSGLLTGGGVHLCNGIFQVLVAVAQIQPIIIVKFDQCVGSVVIARRVKLAGLLSVLAVLPGLFRLVLFAEPSAVLAAEVQYVQAVELGILIGIVEIPLRLRAGKAVSPEVIGRQLGQLVAGVLSRGLLAFLE